MRKVWFQLIDRELRRAVSLPDRDLLETSEWNQWVGKTGERVAGKHAMATGRKVLYRNFKPTRGGEVDLVIRDGDTLVFAEVKTRTSEQFGRPADAVDRQKQDLIVRGANAWLRELNHPEIVFRFDVIEVILTDGHRPDIRVNQAAFSSPHAGLGM